MSKEELEQIKNGTHHQFKFDSDKDKVVCKCGHNAVKFRNGYICGTITAYPCKYPIKDNSPKNNQNDK